MAQISKIQLSQLSEYFGRIDAEFYKPISLNADKLIKKQPHEKLGHLVANGYRVVYESTKILNLDQTDLENDARFLQATNISSNGLWIEVDDVGFVSARDWDRYPKGRIEHGEVLIEVKGQAEKVTIVQDYVPKRTLVTGSVFKLSIKKNTISHEYLFAFFSSKYGTVLRDRTKVNTLIAYVSKPELYRIPIPIPITHIHDQITELVKQSFRKHKLSKDLYAQAVQLLNDALGLNNIEFKKGKRFNVISFSELVATNRFDGQCYKPEFVRYQEWIESKCKYDKLGDLTEPFIKGKQQNILKSGIPYASIKDIDGIELKTNSFCRSSTSVAQKESLLLAITGATIGKIGVVYRNENLAFSGDLLNIKPKNQEVPTYYLLCVLSTQIGQTQINRWITGSTNGHLSPIDVRKILIPRLESEKEQAIENLLRKSISYKVEAETLLEHAKQEVETLIEQGALIT